MMPAGIAAARLKPAQSSFETVPSAGHPFPAVAGWIKWVMTSGVAE
jgi:hypothetical protein